MLAESLFFVGDFEPGWWTSPEARAWVTLLLEVGTKLPVQEPILLSYRNVMSFARSSLGMNVYEVRIARSPGDLDRNSWVGYLSDFGQFEVCFEELALLNEAESRLRVAGFSTTPIFPAPLYKLAIRYPEKSNLREKMTHLIAGWDRES